MAVGTDSHPMEEKLLMTGFGGISNYPAPSDYSRQLAAQLKSE